MSDGGFCFYCRRYVCECPDQDPEEAAAAAEIRALNGRVGEMAYAGGPENHSVLLDPGTAGSNPASSSTSRC